ncbi:hypothetical protein D9611_003122 [Ephemerocybe angulata]|uniref:Small ribosomal subunit protein mS35 mitochondrial conserved domain-containing protein n=1 Tax=Ephemerocybe angulata TaxID=980116 RepID=A0A8H5CA57_9AGAR|nr:hypothetical protein D9611_003122 [Tulosesus angulatus]
MASTALRLSRSRLSRLAQPSSSRSIPAASSASAHAPLAPRSLLLRRFASSGGDVEMEEEGTSRRKRSVLEQEVSPDDLFELLTEPNDVGDMPSLTHRMMMEKRRMLHYFRLIEHEMPKLVAYRKPFIPPNSKETPLYVKSISYQGENHPAVAKRAIVVNVDDLPLADAAAVHTIKLLAGPRWTPNPPKDAGVMEQEAWGNGYIKISCETYSNGEQNLKWASDALDRLVEQANNQKESFADLPLDMRHVYAKVRKGKKGDHRRDRPLRPVSKADFPKEWLPRTAASS